MAKKKRTFIRILKKDVAIFEERNPKSNINAFCKYIAQNTHLVPRAKNDKPHFFYSNKEEVIRRTIELDEDLLTNLKAAFILKKYHSVSTMINKCLSIIKVP